MASSRTSLQTPDGFVVARLPFGGTWLTEVSPSRQIPSHGSDLFATTYALDFMAVDERDRTAPTCGPATIFGVEPPELFYAFGSPLSAPVDGEVVAIHDGEPDHVARRSLPALIPYSLTQGRRIRQGIGAITGNHVIIRDRDTEHFVGLMHLKLGSLSVAQGDRVRVGDRIGACGNSGKSTQPHLHIQAMSGPDLNTARGLPLRFVELRERERSTRWSGKSRARACPEQSTIITRPCGPL
ncbi:M23 family metallopeptidase [Actinomyces israelii]|uniref:M23 family metallopeptidase n=1 Tax=Actinomyces israelii TaxID=1659 RepID=UPI0023528B36|nr:M23 family metallopeptidase [Actinomyces israelii]